MMKIKIQNIRIKTIIGILKWERTQKQSVILNLELKLQNYQKAIQSDQIEDTVDYEKLTISICKAVENTTFQLLETLANFILDLIFQNKNVQQVTLELKKPNALNNGDVSIVLQKNHIL